MNWGYVPGALEPRMIPSADARALVLARSGPASPAAPASPTPLRNVRRLALFEGTVPSGDWPIPDAAFTAPPDDAADHAVHDRLRVVRAGGVSLNRTYMRQM